MKTTTIPAPAHLKAKMQRLADAALSQMRTVRQALAKRPPPSLQTVRAQIRGMNAARKTI